MCFGLGMGECVCWGLQDFGLLSEVGDILPGPCAMEWLIVLSLLLG